MHKKLIVGLVVLVVLMALGGLWLRSQERESGPSIAALPPAHALGFIAFPGLPQVWSDVRQTKFFQRVSSPAFWQTALGPDGYQRLSEGWRAMEAQLGFPLTEQTVGPLLAREFGVAIVPRQGGTWPFDVIIYARVSGTEKVIESLTRTFSWAKQDLVRETQTVEKVEITTLRPKGADTSLSYAFLGTLAVLSTDPAWVIDALKAHTGAASERLHNLPIFRDMRVEKAEALLAYAYYDVEGIQSQMMAKMPQGENTPSPETLRMLQPTGRVSSKATRTSGGVKVETLALYPQRGDPQMFRRTEQGGAQPPFPGVPAETVLLLHFDMLDPQGLWKLIREVAAKGHDDALPKALDQFRQRTGVDFEKEVLTTFTGVFDLGITGPFGPQGGSVIPLPGLFLTLGIVDEGKARQLIQTVGTKTSGPQFEQLFKSTIHDKHEILHLATPLLFIKPGYITSHNHLILASDVSLLQHMLDAASHKTRTLAETAAYQEMLKQFRIKGGSIAFVDVATVLEKAREWWAGLAFLTKALQQLSPENTPAELRSADPWALTELFRPIRYLGSVSQGETQGMRTESFIALEDLK